jgi:mono/diheme cytochrome c family protein
VKTRIPSFVFALTLICVSLVIAQQDGPIAAKPPATNKTASVYAELAKAPEKARVKRNPLESDPDAIPAGRKLFERHCAECHGSAAEGSKRAPSLRAPEVQTAAPGTIFWVLTNGVVRRGMPVWSRLPEPQRWQLVTYIKSLGSGSADKSTAPPDNR